MNKKNWPAAALALFCIVASPAVLARDEDAPPTEQLRDFVTDKGGRLAIGQTNILVNAHDQCRWLDNTSGASEYFVPLASAAEWEAFVQHAPSTVTRAECCLPETVTLTAADGQSSTHTLPIGRDGDTGPNGTHSISRDFTITRAIDGATWTQSLSQRFNCRDGAWMPEAVVASGAEPPLVETPPPPPVEAEIVQVSPTCRGPGRDCQWSGTGVTANPNSYNWVNAMRACAAAGYQYLVAAAGSDYDDCSSCYWSLWNVSSQPNRHDIPNYSIPPTNSGAWSGRGQGSWSSAGALRKVWCSNAPNQKLPPQCLAGQYTFTERVCAQTGFRGACARYENGTITVTLPDGYASQRLDNWTIIRPVHPTDTMTMLGLTVGWRGGPGTLTHAASRASKLVYPPVSGTLVAPSVSRTVTKTPECTNAGWTLLP